MSDERKMASDEERKAADAGEVEGHRLEDAQLEEGDVEGHRFEDTQLEDGKAEAE